MSSEQWLVAARRRLRLDVVPMMTRCPICKQQFCDVKGDHSIICSRSSSRNLRHNGVRNMVAMATRQAGFKTCLEHHGGLTDGRRPGDVIVYNWEGEKHLLIDVAVIDPTADTHKSDLIKGGVGWAATCYEKRKWDRYPDIDSSSYVFMPFILETHGGASRVAINFCKELDQRRLSKTCISSGENSSKVELLEGLNIEVQKFNSTAILERTPPSDTLTMATDIRHELAMKRTHSLYLTCYFSSRTLKLFFYSSLCQIWPS